MLCNHTQQRPYICIKIQESVSSSFCYWYETTLEIQIAYLSELQFFSMLFTVVLNLLKSVRLLFAQQEHSTFSNTSLLNLDYAKLPKKADSPWLVRNHLRFTNMTPVCTFHSYSRLIFLRTTQQSSDWQVGLSQFSVTHCDFLTQSTDLWLGPIGNKWF